MSVWAEQRIYARHILALFAAGGAAPVHLADRNQPGDLAGWTEEDRRLMIEEARRQVDRQHDDLERVRGRAQVVLAVALALVGTAGSLYDDVKAIDGPVLWIVWIVSLLVGAWAVLGAAAASVVRADMETIHAAVLSRRAAPIQEGLAADYSRIVIAGENQVACRLTNIRWAVTHLLAAALLTLIVWLAAAGGPEHAKLPTGTSTTQRDRSSLHRRPDTPRRVCGSRYVMARMALGEPSHSCTASARFARLR